MPARGNLNAVPKTTAHTAAGPTRTADCPQVYLVLLYQLSYNGICAAGRRKRSPAAKESRPGDGHPVILLYHTKKCKKSHL